MKISLIDPKSDNRWDQFVMNHRFGTIYHLADWIDVLESTFAYEPFCLVLENSDGTIRAGIPFMKVSSWLTGRRLVSLPRTPYCDPLVDTQEDLKMLLDFARELVVKGKIGYFEIKTQYNHNIFGNDDIKCYKYFKNHVLFLNKNRKELWNSLHRSCVKQPINRAERKGVKVREGRDEEDLKKFYALLEWTSKKHMIPVRPFSFFRNIWNKFHAKGMTLLLIADLDGTAAAANLSFKFKERMYYEFLGLNYDLISYSPGHLLLWETIQRAQNDVLQYFDFGLTPPENEGLMDFKRRWGAQEMDLNYFYLPDVIGYKKFVKGSPAKLAETPVGVANFKEEIKRFIAGKLYKHFG
jgi:hypothetical protein